MRTRARRNVVPLLAAALALASWLAYRFWTPQAPPEGFLRVRRQQVRRVIEERGYTALVQTYRVTAQVPGLFYPEPLRPGNHVEAGQQLGQIDPERFALEVELARAKLDRARAALRVASFEGIEETLLLQARALIASMDHTVQAAEAQVSSARARFAYRRDFLRRVKRLYEQQAVSEDELHRAQVATTDADVALRQAEVVALALKAVREAVAVLPKTITEQLQQKRLQRAVHEAEQRAATVSLKLAELNRSRATLRAPVDGILLSYPVRNPQAVSPGFTVATIGRSDDLEVVAELLSADAARLPDQCKVELLWEPDGDPLGTTTIDRIEPLGFTKVSSLGVEQQRVKVHILLPRDVVRSLSQRVALPVGYELWLRFIVAERRETLAVPASAVYDAPDGSPRILVWDGHDRIERKVTLGIVGDDLVEIVRGVKEGEWVAIAPEQFEE